MAGRPATIVDVARHAGVSHSTVSRVLNGYPHVSADTRARVEQAAHDLGYVANLNARGLAGGRSGLVGVVTFEVSSSYIIGVLRGIDGELAASEHDMMLSTNRLRDQRERDHVTRLSQGPCDGLIVLIPSASELYAEDFAARGYPLVLIDHAATTHASTVTTQNRAGAEQATRHLIELGHRRIGHIGGIEQFDASDARVEGWRSTLAAHDLDHGDDLIVGGDFQRESGRVGTAELLDRPDPPTAIFAANDMAAVGVLDELRARGLRCPDDVSVVGFDDVPEATLMTPTLTTVRQPMEALGREAVRLLLARIEDPAGPVAHLELATELVVRASTGPPPTA